MNLPTLYRPPNSHWWHFSWYSPNGRVRASCRSIGLSADIPGAEAQSRLIDYLELAGSKPENGDHTLGSFLKFLENRTDPDITSSTYALYLKDFRLFVKLLGNDFPLADVKRIPHVAQFQEWLRSHTKRNATTINMTCRSVQACFQRLSKGDEAIPVTWGNGLSALFRCFIAFGCLTLSPAEDIGSNERKDGRCCTRCGNYRASEGSDGKRRNS